MCVVAGCSVYFVFTPQGCDVGSNRLPDDVPSELSGAIRPFNGTRALPDKLPRIQRLSHVRMDVLCQKGLAYPSHSLSRTGRRPHVHGLP